ncbi:hypothetical protein KR018_005118 [Drosophila ironensis]|nr:hypothetical protein KR018_005118 [Drosophila ironensis]
MLCKLKFVWLSFFVNLVRSKNAFESPGTVPDTESGRMFSNVYKSNLRQVVKIKNDSLDPCIDFYAHACGNFNKVLENEDPDESLPPFLYNKQDRMSFFTAQVGNFVTVPGKLLNQIYSECRQRSENHVLRDRNPLQHWHQLLEEIPFLTARLPELLSWPFLHHQWQRRRLNEKLNWISLSAQLAAHGLPTLLHIYFALDTIYVAPMEEFPCPSLEDFQRSLMDVLEGRHHHVSYVIAQEMKVLCRGIREEFSLVRSSMKDSKTTETPTVQKQLIIDENILEYFEQFFAALNFTKQQLDIARKLSLNVDKITISWDFLRQTEPRIVYNYVLWQAKEHLRYPDCYLLSQEFERLLHAEYWQWYVFKPHLSREVALASYQLHTTRFQQRRKTALSRRDWYSQLLPSSVERRELHVARILQAYAQSYLNITELNEYYGKLNLLENSFHKNLLLLRRAQLQHTFASVYIDEEDANQPAYFLRHFLHFVILSLHRPTYHYYATQGLEVWKQSRLLLDTDGQYTAWDCLEKQSVQQTAVIYRPLSWEEIKEIFHFHRCFQASLRDYKFWLQGERFAFAESFVLQYFGLNTQKILFYAVAQQMCNRQNEIFAAQLNRGYMNIPEFQEAFRCNTNKAMSPTTRCMIPM